MGRPLLNALEREDEKVNGESKFGKEIRNLMNKEQTQHRKGVSDQQNQERAELKAQYEEELENF